MSRACLLVSTLTYFPWKASSKNFKGIQKGTFDLHQVLLLHLGEVELHDSAASPDETKCSDIKGSERTEFLFSFSACNLNADFPNVFGEGFYCNYA